MKEKMKSLQERFPRPADEKYPEEVQKAINAMNRASEKMIERKRALGHKMVVWKDGEMVVVDP